MIRPAASCLHALSRHARNVSEIVDGGLVAPLIALLAYDDSKARCDAIMTLHYLATSSQQINTAIINACASERIRERILDAPPAVQSDILVSISPLDDSDPLRAVHGTLLVHPHLRNSADCAQNMGILDVIIPLTAASSAEIAVCASYALLFLSRQSVMYSVPFESAWQQPAGGLERYFIRTLRTGDAHLIWVALDTIVLQLKLGNRAIASNIGKSTTLMPLVRHLANGGFSPVAGQSVGEAGLDGDLGDGNGYASAQAKANAASALKILSIVRARRDADEADGPSASSCRLA